MGVIGVMGDVGVVIALYGRSGEKKMIVKKDDIERIINMSQKEHMIDDMTKYLLSLEKFRRFLPDLVRISVERFLDDDLVIDGKHWEEYISKGAFTMYAYNSLKQMMGYTRDDAVDEITVYALSLEDIRKLDPRAVHRSVHQYVDENMMNKWQNWKEWIDKDLFECYIYRKSSKELCVVA